MKFISIPEKYKVESEDGSFVVFTPDPKRQGATGFTVSYHDKQFIFLTADNMREQQSYIAQDGAFVWFFKRAGCLLRGYDQETRELCRYESFKKFVNREEQDFFINNFTSAMAVFTYIDGSPTAKRGPSRVEFSDELKQAFEVGAFIK